MFTDICLPKNNEEKYLKVAEKLGTKGILFLYEKKIKELNIKSEVKIYQGLLVKTNPGKPGIYFAKGERKNVESKNVEFLYGFEELELKDSFHYRRAGVNQVIAKIIKEKKKVLVIDMKKTLTSKEPQILLGRLKQNLMMIKKYKLNLIICSFATKPYNLRSSKDYEALIRSLGYQEEAKKATSLLAKKLN